MIHTDFVHREQYSIIAALSTGGYKTLWVVAGLVDAEEFFDFIVNKVVCISHKTNSVCSSYQK